MLFWLYFNTLGYVVIIDHLENYTMIMGAEVRPLDMARKRQTNFHVSKEVHPGWIMLQEP